MFINNVVVLRSGNSTLVPQRKCRYVHPTAYISTVLDNISNSVIAVPRDSSQETGRRGYDESRTDGNRADPSRERSYKG